MPRLSSLAATVLILACVARPAHSQPAADDTLKFLAGGAAAFALHESGHLLFDEIFDAHPQIKSVRYGFVPFFAITPEKPMAGRKLYTIAAAGFWTQELTSELLNHDGDLRHEHAPFAKGMLAFDVLTSVGYSVAAFTRTGPTERDTRSMAEGSGVSEPAIGAMVLAPAALAAYRYFHPRSRWAKWASRVVDAASVALVAKSGQD